MIRGAVQDWDTTDQTLSAELLDGSLIEASAIGRWPAPGALGYFEEYAPGLWVCLGVLPEEGTAYSFAADTSSGLTVGNGSFDAYYSLDANWVHYWGTFTFGSTSSIASGVLLTLPLTADGFRWSGTAVYTDSSASVNYTATCFITTSGTALAFKESAGSSNWNATLPFTWATGDTAAWSIRFCRV